MSRSTDVVLMLALPLLLAGSAGGQMLAHIVGSAHDFSGQGWAQGEICLPCHTPHHAMLTVDDAPLWNHEITGASFTMYPSGSLVGTIAPEPRGPSKLCLSCHDGVTALDSYGGQTGTTLISGSANIGTDLRTTHPVSVEWTHQTQGGQCSRCHNVHQGQGPFLTGDITFYDGYVECSSCHEVHNSYETNGNLLRLPMDGSELCLFCH